MLKTSKIVCHCGNGIIECISQLNVAFVFTDEVIKMCNQIFNYHLLLMWLKHSLEFNSTAQRGILNL